MESMSHHLFDDFYLHALASSPIKESCNYTEFLSNDLAHLMSQTDVNYMNQSSFPNDESYFHLFNDPYESNSEDITIINGLINSNYNFLNDSCSIENKSLVQNDQIIDKDNDSLDTLNVSLLFDEDNIHNVLNEFIIEFDKSPKSMPKSCITGIEASDGFGLLDKLEREMNVTTISKDEISCGSQNEILPIKIENKNKKKSCEEFDSQIRIESGKTEKKQWNTENSLIHFNSKNLKNIHKINSEIDMQLVQQDTKSVINIGSESNRCLIDERVKLQVLQNFMKNDSKEKEMKEKAKSLSETIKNQAVLKLNQSTITNKDKNIYFHDHAYTNNLDSFTKLFRKQSDIIETCETVKTKLQKDVKKQTFIKKNSHGIPKIILCSNGYKSHKKMTSILNTAKLSSNNTNAHLKKNKNELFNNKLTSKNKVNNSYVIDQKLNSCQNEHILKYINYTTNIDNKNGMNNKNIKRISDKAKHFFCEKINEVADVMDQQTATSKNETNDMFIRFNNGLDNKDGAISHDKNVKSNQSITYNLTNVHLSVPEMLNEIIISNGSIVESIFNPIGEKSKVVRKLSLSEYKQLLPRRRSIYNKPKCLPNNNDIIEYDYCVTSDHNYCKFYSDQKIVVENHICDKHIEVNRIIDNSNNGFKIQKPSENEIHESKDRSNSTTLHSKKENSPIEPTSNVDADNDENLLNCTNIVEKSTLSNQFLAELCRKKHLKVKNTLNTFNSKQLRINEPLSDVLVVDSNIIDVQVDPFMESSSGKPSSMSSGIVSDFQLSPSTSSQHSSRSSVRSKSRSTLSFQKSLKNQNGRNCFYNRLEYWSRNNSQSTSRSNSRNSSRSTSSRSWSRSTCSSRSSSITSRSSSRSPSRSLSRSRSPLNNRKKLKKCSRQRAPNENKNGKQAMEERRVVYVNCLPHDYSRHDLEEKLSVFGKIIDSSVHSRQEGSSFGFVTYATSSQAAQAIQDGPKVKGCASFEFCYGGRREFCGSNYFDLDYDERYLRLPRFKKSASPCDFQSMLLDTLECIKNTRNVEMDYS